MKKYLKNLFVLGLLTYAHAQAKAKGDSNWICGDGPTAIQSHFYKDLRGNVVLEYTAGHGKNAGSAIFILDGVQRNFDGLMVPGPTPGSTVDITQYIAYRLSTVPVGSSDPTSSEMILVQVSLLDADGKIAMILSYGFVPNGLDYNVAQSDASRVFRPAPSRSCSRVKGA